VIGLARTSTDPDERDDFFEHGAGCRELGVANRDARNVQPARSPASGALPVKCLDATPIPSPVDPHDGNKLENANETTA